MGSQWPYYWDVGPLLDLPWPLCGLDSCTSEPGGAWTNSPLGPELSVSPTPTPSSSVKAGTGHKDPEVPAYLRLRVLSKSRCGEGAAVISCVSQPHPGPQHSGAWEFISLISSVGSSQAGFPA